MESVHQKLERVRKPRVHIKYEVETEGAIVTKELPFVIGVLGDFSGKPTQPLPPLRERQFVQIDRDNFDAVMQRMQPTLQLQVENKLQTNASTLAVNLTFKSMEDFEPANIVQQVPALRVLLETRNKLRDLLTKIDRSDELENLLEQLIQNQGDLQQLAHALATNAPSATILEKAHV